MSFKPGDKVVILGWNRPMVVKDVTVDGEKVLCEWFSGSTRLEQTLDAYVLDHQKH